MPREPLISCCWGRENMNPCSLRRWTSGSISPRPGCCKGHLIVLLPFMASFSKPGGVSGVIIVIYLFIAFSFFFLGPHPQHMEVPRRGVKLELRLLAYSTATATWDLSHIRDLHHSSWQHQILNMPSEARDRIRVLMDTSRVC